MWYEVDSDGVTVFTPVVGTSPMPSIATEVASVERQFSTTWSPAEIESGVAVICTVGAGAVAGGAIGGGGSGFFFLQPPATTKTASSATGKRILESRLSRFNASSSCDSSASFQGLNHSMPQTIRRAMHRKFARQSIPFMVDRQSLRSFGPVPDSFKSADGAPFIAPSELV
jgi:hypothetical protein